MASALRGSRDDGGDDDEATEQKYKEAWDLAVAGRIDEIDYSIRVRHYNTLKCIALDYAIKPDCLNVKSCGYWIHSPPDATNAGERVRQLWPDDKIYLKSIDKWFNGYHHEPTVLLENIGLEHVSMGHTLWWWAGYFPFRADKRGSTMEIRPKRIVVTSKYTIEEIFALHPDRIEQLKERFTLRFMLD